MEELGRFIIREELGAGPYSVLYEARDGSEHCALRVLNEDTVPEDSVVQDSLRAALKGLARIEHPSVVKVRDAGEEAGRIYLSMELMSCPTLEQRLQEEGPLEEKQVVLFVRQAAQALDKARDVGYPHGDLTASNVFVVSNEKIKLSDFAYKAFIENPESLESFAPEPAEDIFGEEEEWVTAEELLSSKGGASAIVALDEDFTLLAVLMLQMLGAEVPERGGQSLEDYRSELLSGPVAELGTGEAETSVQTQEVVRRLLTPGGFDSPGEVVVELASAMLLRRPAAAEAGGAAMPSAETVAVDAGDEEQEERLDVAEGELEMLHFRGDPRAAAFTPFFVWHGRRGGRFFLIHDGERLTVGRDPDYADVALMDPAISRKHVVFSREGSTIRVEDLGSTNGTFVNEERIDSAEVRPGDCVRVGATRLYMSLPDREQ
ncbi:MAG: FHA domain-containing protein [Candidatus Brocadiia bacterium]